MTAFAPLARTNPLWDDHKLLNEIAKIPTIDILDFEYPVLGPRASIGTPRRTCPRIAVPRAWRPSYGASTNGC